MPARLASNYKHMQNMTAICGRNRGTAVSIAVPSFAAKLLRVLQKATPKEQTANLLKLRFQNQSQGM
jgi:hypothetical protein